MLLRFFQLLENINDININCNFPLLEFKSDISKCINLMQSESNIFERSMCW